MKKRTIFVFTLVALFVLAITTVALAKDVTYTLKGMITAVEDPDPGTITVYNEAEGLVTVFLPDGFDIATLAPGYMVTAEGLWVAGGFDAEQVTVTKNVVVGVINAIDPVLGKVTIDIGGGVLITAVLPAGYPIETLTVGDTVRFEGSWVAGEFVVTIFDVCVEGLFLASLGLYGETGREAISVDVGGTAVTVLLPAGFVSSGLVAGDTVRACGMWVDETDPPDGVVDYLDASSVEINPVDEEEDEIEPGGRGGVYCDGEKGYHPVAVKIAKMYGWEEDGMEAGEEPPVEPVITPGWVMDQFCAGLGFGEIMLALKAEALLPEGTDLDPRAILSMRNDMGWGQIWKELGVSHGNKENHSPPGLQTEQDETSLPPGLAKKQDRENHQPPGLANKPEKAKGPNKNK